MEVQPLGAEGCSNQTGGWSQRHEEQSVCCSEERHRGEDEHEEGWSQ